VKGCKGYLYHDLLRSWLAFIKGYVAQNSGVLQEEFHFTYGNFRIYCIISAEFTSCFFKKNTDTCTAMHY